MLPTTIADIDRLIRDGVQEDLHLDLKDRVRYIDEAPALKSVMDD